MKQKWDYRNSFISRSWDLDMGSGENEQGRQITYGFWLSETTDRPAAPEVLCDAWPLESYATLQDGDIRVLNLMPGKHGEPLVGSFDIVKPQLASCYEALSYVWGTPGWDGNLSILLKSLSGSRNLRITPNLEVALNDVRSTTEVRRLWVDAICINQMNLTERAQQVEMMTAIYREARSVLICLGRETRHSMLGMLMLEDMCRGKLAVRGNSYLDLPPHTLQSALCDILERPYFKRLWVVQEAALARAITMICGQSRMRWTSSAATIAAFVRNFKLAATSPKWSTSCLRDIELDDFLQLLERQLINGPDASKWAKRQRRPDLLSSAYLYRRRSASDQRDKIYGLLGLLADESTAEMLKPDYQESVEDLFARFAGVVNKQSEELFRELLAEMHDQESDLLMQPADQRNVPSTGKWQESLDEESLSTAESQCLAAIRHMRQGELDKATRLLGRASIILHSELERPLPK